MEAIAQVVEQVEGHLLHCHTAFVSLGKTLTPTLFTVCMYFNDTGIRKFDIGVGNVMIKISIMKSIMTIMRRPFMVYSSLSF